MILGNGTKRPYSPDPDVVEVETPAKRVASDTVVHVKPRPAGVQQKAKSAASKPTKPRKTVIPKPSPVDPVPSSKPADANSAKPVAPVPAASKAPAPAAPKAPVPAASRAPLPVPPKVPVPAASKAPLPAPPKVPVPAASKALVPAASKAPLPAASKSVDVVHARSIPHSPFFTAPGTFSSFSVSHDSPFAPPAPTSPATHENILDFRPLQVDFDSVRVEDELVEDELMEEEVLRADLRDIVQKIIAMEDTHKAANAEIGPFITVLNQHAELITNGLASIADLYLHSQIRDKEIKEICAFVVKNGGATYNEYGQLVYECND